MAKMCPVTRRQIVNGFWLVTAWCVLHPVQLTSQSQLSTWSLQPELRIGSVEGPTALAAIRHFVISPNTGAVVLSQGPHDIQIFSPDGRFLRTIGRHGSGPGEFNGLSGLGWADSLLVALDGNTGRVTLFSEDGRLIESKRVEGANHADGRFRSFPVARMADGHYLIRYSIGYDAVAPGEPLREPLMRSDGRGNDEMLDELVQPPAWHITSSQGPIVGPQPLAWQSILAVDPRGRSVVIVHQHAPSGNHDGSFRVRKLDGQGRVLFARSYHVTPRPVPQQFRDDYVRSIVARIRPRYAVPRLEATVADAIQVPRFQPPVTSALVSVDGYIWLRREALGVEIVTWWVLDPRGDLVAQVGQPRRNRMLHADGSMMWVMELDDLDVPYAVRHRIRKN